MSVVADGEHEQEHDDHGHGHGHGHEHDHEHGHPDHTVILEQQVLAKNDGIAVHNRQWMRSRRITALNIMSSPGAGKTTLLARTIRELGCQRPIAVIEGDQETRLDAERIRETGASVVQVNTGAVSRERTGELELIAVVGGKRQCRAATHGQSEHTVVGSGGRRAIPDRREVPG